MRCWASRNYLSSSALREADNIRAQLRLIMERFDIDIILSGQKDLSVNIRRTLVCGFFMPAAHKEGTQGSSYCTVGGNQVNSYFDAWNISLTSLSICSSRPSSCIHHAVWSRSPNGSSSTNSFLPPVLISEPYRR